MRQNSSFAALVFIVILGIGIGLAVATFKVTDNPASVLIIVAALN